MQKLSWLLLLFFVAGSYRTFAQAPASDKMYLLNVHAIGADRAAVRATRDFWQQAGDQKQEQWYKLPQGYLAEYTEGRIKAQYRYDVKGNWLFCILTYTQKEMPEAVRRLVRSTYYDYTIGWVKEVHEADVTSYVVHVEDPASWKDLVVRDGEITVWHDFNK